MTDGTNLLDHVKNQHQDMLNQSPPPPPQISTPYSKPNPADYVDDDAIDYSKFVDDDDDELLKRLAALDAQEAGAASSNGTTTTTTTTVTPPHVGSRFVGMWRINLDYKSLMEFLF